jgi:uncharacterized protein (DUF1800 family)
MTVLAVAPAHAQTGALSSLTVSGLSPAFDPAVTQYTIPRTAACSVNVSATLANPSHRLYIANAETASGAIRSAWVCDGITKISVVIYAGWTEVGRYTINLVSVPSPSPTPAAPTATATAAQPVFYVTSITVAGMIPAFDPAITQYTLTRTAACSVPVTASLADTSHKLYVGGNQIASGATSNAWVCDGRTKIDVIVYQVWTEKARYTITLIDPTPTPTVPPTGTPTPTDAPTATPTDPPAPTTEPDPSPAPSPQPTQGLPPAEPTDALTAERLLQQATFGPTAAEMVAVQTKGPHLWLAEQLEIPASSMPDGLDTNQVRAQLFLNMANGQDQLRQRMTFALGQTLVVSTNKLVNGYELIPWIRLLQTHAFGNYRTLLREVTLSPSMGKFLDLANSIGTGGQAPNENYPRELLQLFSIGLVQLNMDGSTKTLQGQPIPTYDQAGLKEFARALSGWTYPTQPGQQPVSQNPDYFVGQMEPRPQSHDSGAKTLFGHIVLPAGQTPEEDLDDVIDAVFEHPNVPPFVATRLIRSLVTSNPSAAYIERVANAFADNGQGTRGDLKAVLVAILTDPDAALPHPIDGRMRDPVLHVIGLARALGVPVANPTQFLYVMANLGQQVLSPPSVFSFYSPLAPLPGDPTKFGPEFQLYTPALSIQRANFIYSILNGGFGSSFPVNLAPYTALAGDPQTLVEHVNQQLLFGRMSPELRAVLVATAQATSSLQQRALGTLYLTAISSEFAVHTGN